MFKLASKGRQRKCIVFTARCTQCTRGIAILCRPSVRLSVRDVDVPWAYRFHQFEVNYTNNQLGSSLLGPTTSAIQSKGNTPKIRVEQGWGAVFSRKPAISRKRGKIGPRLLLTTNRKLHMCFRLVPKSTTLDDLEGPLRTVFQNTSVFRSPPRKFE